MHIPDGMLDTKTWVTGMAASAGSLGYAVAYVRKNFSQQRIVLMAVLAALVFALQMLNFPVAGGTSGHFAGGAAAAILLGPWAAAIVITSVLFVQAVMFADGGILALGANVLNLAVIAPLVGWGVYRVFTATLAGRAGRVIGAFVAAWMATVAAALAAGFEIWASGNAPIGVVLVAMGGWHALIGIGEGVITAGLVGYVLAVRPSLLQEAMPEHRGLARVALGFGVLALIAVSLSFLASSHPDGLEFVYFEEGIGKTFETVRLLPSPIPDYAIPGLTNEVVAGVLAGLVGVIVTGAFLYVGVQALRRRGEGA